MNLLHKIKSSIYDPEFYSELTNHTLGSSFKYFFGFIFLVALLYTIFVSAVYEPKTKAFFVDIGEKIVTNYPQELEVTIKDGIASTNVSEPYFIKVPSSMVQNSGTTNTNAPENLLVIDTKNDFTTDTFDSYKTLAVLTKDSLVVKDSNGKITINPLKNTPNTVINHSSVEGWVKKVMPLVRFLPFIFPVVCFIAIYLSYVFTLLYLLVASLLVFLIARFRKHDLTYAQSYQVALHAVTLPIFLSLLAFVFGLPVVAFIPSIILIIAVWVNLKPSNSPSPVV